jgi:hypothetical protein
VYGASMVNTDAPTAISGSVSASATTASASRSRPKTCTVRTYRLTSSRLPQTTAGRRTAKARLPVWASDQAPAAAQPARISQATSGPLL